MNYFIVFDFETDGTDPETCQPVQVASVAIDPFNLEVVDGSEFCSDMKPIGIDKDEYFTDSVNKTIAWHAGIAKTTKEDVIKRWKSAPAQKLVWKNFVQHINKYNKNKAQYSAPVPCGMNIRNFDLPIVRRLNSTYKVSRLFNYEVVDLRDLFFYSLVWDNEVRSRSMDNMRKYFGMSNAGAHDALQDVKDTSVFIIRYLKFFKNVFNRGENPYKGCMLKC
jgi:DNA polymerase III epsilon subunit-like protein